MSRRIPLCPECGRECFNLGYKVAIPRRSAAKSWRLIRMESRRRLLVWDAYMSRYRVRRRHYLEKEIARMGAMEPNRERSRQIRKMQDQLQKSDLH